MSTGGPLSVAERREIEATELLQRWLRSSPDPELRPDTERFLAAPTADYVPEAATQGGPREETT